MRQQLHFLDITIELTGAADSNSRTLLKELQGYGSTAIRKDVSGTLSIKKAANFRIPKQACLKGFWRSSGLRHYAETTTHFWVQGKSAIVSNLHTRGVEIHLGDNPSAEFIAAARNAIKWLIIKAAEKSGYGYAHAAAAYFRGRSILLPGNPGAGKSSFVMRLMKAGAVVLNDDVTLIHLGSGRMIPLALNLHVKGDFSKRFNVSPRERWAWFRDEAVKEAEKVKGVDVILFPQVWAASESRVKKLSPEETEIRLDGIYLKEMSWNAFPAPSQRMKSAHRKMIKNADSYVFYCGTHEAKIQKRLENFLKKYEE